MFVLPTFNLVCHIFHDYQWVPPVPPAGVPDVVSPCNLQFGRKGAEAKPFIYGSMLLLLPARTDLRDHSMSSGGFWGDAVEVPAGSGRWYVCEFTDDVSRGFATEYRVGVLLRPGAVLGFDVFTSLHPWP